MKKSLSFLIIPAMLISSCALTSRCSAFFDKLFKRNKNQDTPITIDNVVDGLEKLEDLDSFTAVTNVTFNGTDSKSIKSQKVPTKSNTVMTYKTEHFGENSKTIMSYDSTETAKISEVQTILNMTSLEETIDLLLQLKYEALQSEYSNQNVEVNIANDEVKFVSTYEGETTYVLYDQEAKQTYDYEEDDDSSRYNTSNGGIGIVDAKDIIEVVKKGKVEGDVVKTEVDGQEIEIKVAMENGYISRLEATLQESTHLVIEYSKINETSFDLPAEARKPECIWAHDGQTPFYLKTTDEGHRRYCQYCYKFLDEQVVEHVHAHNDKGICEICGYIPGEEDVDSDPIPGFENGENDYFLYGKLINNNIISNSYASYSYSFRVEEEDSDENAIDYRVFLDENVVLVGKEGKTTSIEASCLKVTPYEYTIYRNCSNDALKAIEDEYKLDYYPYSATVGSLKTYLSGLTKSASLSASEYKISHNSHYEDPVVIDACHKYSASRCTECGQLLYASILTSHTETLVETEEVIDACHKLVKSDCPVCHEHNEEIVTNHVSGDPRLESTDVDPCHKLVKGYCATCGEYLGKMVVDNHTGSTSTKEIVVDSCTTRTLTICDSCHCIVNSEEVSNHLHTHKVVCDGNELRDYPFYSELNWPDENDTFVFEYCEDCHRPVNGIVYEYYSSTGMDHQYSDNYYTIHDISGENDHMDNGFGKFDHELDDNDMCKYCHSKVIAMGDSEIGFIARYNANYDYWDNYYFFNKETGENIYIYSFDSTPDAGADANGNYNEFTNESYPGISLRVYEVEYEVVRLELRYNSLTELAVILPSDFE